VKLASSKEGQCQTTVAQFTKPIMTNHRCSALRDFKDFLSFFRPSQNMLPIISVKDVFFACPPQLCSETIYSSLYIYIYICQKKIKKLYIAKNLQVKKK